MERKYDDRILSLNTTGKIKDLHKEAFPDEYPDEHGLVPNTWYVMTKGSRSIGFYKGWGKKTIGISPQHPHYLLKSCSLFSDKLMRSTNVIRANINKNVLPKMIAVASHIGYKPNGSVRDTYTNEILKIQGEDSFFLVNEVLYCMVKTKGGYKYEIQLIKNDEWNTLQYVPSTTYYPF